MMSSVFLCLLALRAAKQNSTDAKQESGVSPSPCQEKVSNGNLGQSVAIRQMVAAGIVERTAHDLYIVK
jgi:hypothetical protein